MIKPSVRGGERTNIDTPLDQGQSVEITSWASDIFNSLIKKDMYRLPKEVAHSAKTAGSLFYTADTFVDSGIDVFDSLSKNAPQGEVFNKLSRAVSVLVDKFVENKVGDQYVTFCPPDSIAKAGVAPSYPIYAWILKDGSRYVIQTEMAYF